ncbi:MAG TPA: ergothioneine biosynthesis protein EgtB [Longimicrobiales bacterium]|nr:ergothioneine biosynthesis protein EgtB [Longimicrobiales bacterium]
MLSTLASPPGASLRPAGIADLLNDARARTLLLIGPLSEADLKIQHSELMSPIVWDLGHIAEFEKLWLIDNIKGDVRFGEMPGMYNPFENPRSVRGELALPSLREILELLADVRAAVLGTLDHVNLVDPRTPVLRDGFVYRMVAQHEYQHNETILQTLQLKRGAPYAAPRARSFGSSDTSVPEMVSFPGGRVLIGTDDRSAAYDNERPAHEVDIAPFSIDATPVTNAAYLEFMREGGYGEPRLWSEHGRAWLAETGADAPLYWEMQDGAWHRREMDRMAPVQPDHPVCHVTWYEAEAFAAWAGKRLPTEHEWEAAATWDPVDRSKRAYPWGEEPPTTLHANLDQLAFGTAPVGAHARGASPIGCLDMIGNVWEWTASDFTAWPGYETFPYAEYSEVFFGPRFKVLRGGSWATRPGAVRGTFRNWDYPIRRQIFSGFRCARDG